MFYKSVFPMFVNFCVPEFKSIGFRILVERNQILLSLAH